MGVGRRTETVDVAIVAGLLVVHFTFHRFLVQWAVAPDFLIGALLLASLRLQAGHAAVLGFVLGILEAAIGLEGMGTISIVLTLAAYVAARSRDLLFADARYYIPIYLFIGTWVTQLALLLALGGGSDLPLALITTPLSAASTALVCWAVESLTSAARRY